MLYVQAYASYWQGDKKEVLAIEDLSQPGFYFILF